MRIVLNKLSDGLVRNKKYVQMFFVIFYSVGFFGIRTPEFLNLFIHLTPVALLLSFIVILLFHRNGFDNKTIIVLIAIGLLSFFIEVIGVNTQIIFGPYSYGSGLGFKIFNTPLLIGINWILLIYCSASITGNLPTNRPVKIIVASLLMLVYDIILEQIAPLIDMWYWENNTIPLQNYIAWFIIAALFHSLATSAKIKFKNQIAATIFVCQTLFFLSLIIFNVAK